ncbi:MFS transporter [Sphingomonas sp. CL5.1]|uniref:MFS transporter n=1 Tax=Sphingomonas sp. CL5.1 TaxID=2653203 RepID=UPI001583B59E|nr:MFS transporter [Sphingomonas sp. CL5.1]QKS00269.1 MFS transporter [Sphingomonas sp. CL5.1]
MVEATTPRTFDASPERVQNEAWWMLAVLLLLYTLSFVDRIVISMLVDPIKATLGLSDVQMGLIIGPAFGVAYCIFGYVFGLAADRTSRRKVIFGGVTLWSLSAGLSGLAASFAGLLAFRVGVGAGEAALTPAAYSLLTDRFPRRRLTTAMAIYQMGAKLGAALAFAIGGVSIAFAATIQHTHWPVVGNMEPWQIALALTGLPGVLLALLIFTFREPLRGASINASADRPPLIPFLRSEARALVPMAVGFASISITMYSLTSWAPTYMSRQFGWHPAQYGPALSVISLFGAGSMIVKGMIVDWLYGRGMRDAHLRFFTWLLAAAIPVGAVAFFLTDPWWFLIAYGIMQVVALQFVVFMGATLQLFVPPTLRGQVTGLFLGFFTFLGLGAGPTFTAFLTDYVFQDETKLGMSLATTTCLTIPLAWICLRYALAPVRAVLARQGDPETPRHGA